VKRRRISWRFLSETQGEGGRGERKKSRTDLISIADEENRNFHVSLTCAVLPAEERKGKKKGRGERARRTVASGVSRFGCTRFLRKRPAGGLTLVLSGPRSAPDRNKEGKGRKRKKEWWPLTRRESPLLVQPIVPDRGVGLQKRISLPLDTAPRVASSGKKEGGKKEDWRRSPPSATRHPMHRR